MCKCVQVRKEGKEFEWLVLEGHNGYTYDASCDLSEHVEELTGVDSVPLSSASVSVSVSVSLPVVLGPTKTKTTTS